MEGLFRVAALKEHLELVKAQIDQGVRVDFDKNKTDPIETSDLVKIFFRQLPVCLLDPTGKNWNRWLDALDRERGERLALYKELISQLPPANRDALQELLFFLRQLMFNSHINKMHASNLSLVFSPNLLFKKEDPAAPQDMMAAMDLIAASSKIKIVATDMIEVPHSSSLTQSNLLGWLGR